MTAYIKFKYIKYKLKYEKRIIYMRDMQLT